MTEYNWTEHTSDEPLQNTPISAVNRPSRCALTQLIVESDPKLRTIRLAILHPATFNSWMLPYCTLTLGNQSILRKAVNLLQLMTGLNDISRSNSQAMREALREQFSNYFLGQGPDGFPETHFISYALKYSPNAGQWSAYLFKYHDIPSAQWTRTDIETRLVPISRESLHNLQTCATLDGRPVEPNVLLYLESHFK